MLLINSRSRSTELKTACQSGKSRNTLFLAVSPILHYRAIIILSSTVAFILFFFPLCLSPCPGLARPRLVARAARQTTFTHSSPPPPSRRLFPSASADTSIPVSHSAATRFSLAATPRHVRFPRGRRRCSVAQSAGRRVSLATSPGRIGFSALNDSGSLLSPVIRRLDVHFSYSYTALARRGAPIGSGMHSRSMETINRIRRRSRNSFIRSIRDYDLNIHMREHCTHRTRN